MKINTIILSFAAAVLVAPGCRQEADTLNPYARNVGVEYLTVNTETLDFAGRGGALSFTVESNYDTRLEAPEWVTLASAEVPGDGRVYTVVATAGRNNGEGGAARTGNITLTASTLTKTIAVSQPFYERPDMPENIASADDLVYFLETCAVTMEEGEAISF